MIDLFTASENPTMSNFNKRIKQANAGTFAAFPSASVASAAVVNIDDGADDIPIKSLSVAVEPAQGGSGTPSPDNVRPISGWNALNVNISPTQDAADGKTYSFPFSSTVYGGTFTLSYNGEWSASMVVDRKAVDLAAVAWPNTQTSWGGWASSSAIAELAGLPAVADLKCEKYMPTSYSTVRNGTTPSIAVGQSSDPKKLYVRTGSSAKPTGLLIAPLANPTTITWTQAQLLEILGADGFTTLLGVNNVWADAGDTALTYRQDINILLSRLTALIGG